MDAGNPYAARRDRRTPRPGTIGTTDVQVADNPGGEVLPDRGGAATDAYAFAVCAVDGPVDPAPVRRRGLHVPQPFDGHGALLSGVPVKREGCHPVAHGPARPSTST